MTNLLIVLPDFDVKPYTHLLPSLEKALISTADLLSLDAPDIAKRAQVPPGEVRKLTAALIDGLHALNHPDDDDADDEDPAHGKRRSLKAAEQVSADLEQWQTISTLDDGLDASLNGGIRAGYVTEFVGESAAGKTQFLLTLLLSVQLARPLGLEKSALYISTEAPLQTTRLAQILKSHPKLSTLPPSEQPSLSGVQSTHVHDLEAQDHILRYQVPVAIQRHNVGLLVIDSIAANYRAEFDKGKERKSAAESFAKRSNQVSQIGALLRQIAQTHGVAVVIANQVADRFLPIERSTSQAPTSQMSRPGSPPQPANAKPVLLSQHRPSEASTAPSLLSTDDPLSFDHQQRFFTGWGDEPSPNLKTPALGLTWTNQLATRIALLKEPVYGGQRAVNEEVSVSSWKRTFKVVFSAWCADSKTDFEITQGGVRAVVEEQVDVETS
ncbi:hypothetical protein LTR08_009178 [Meristemomyces frigidus]|nr:hypothetical protein LTR08_009178 [Meristemomyces frigidus]